MKDYNPLVSVGVLTYNSSKYVVDTLESIKAQSYQNIELIVSDDCSTDSTVDICKEWLEKNKNRFVRWDLIVPDKNTGIPANSNRAINASRGEWFKVIAGDDMLFPDAIEKYVDYVFNHEDIQLIFAKMYAFYVKEGQIVEEPFGDVASSSVDFFNNQSPREQYLSLLKDESKVGGAPTMFAKRDLLIKYPFNEEYKGFDDVPEWIKLTKNGVHLNCMDVFTVKYRRGDSLTSPSNRFYSPFLWDSKHQFFWNELRELLVEENLYDVYNRKKRELLKIELMDCLTHNKPTIINKIKSILLARIIQRLYFTDWKQI